MSPYINEILPDPPSGGVEWVEIYNPTDTTLDLHGWRLRDCTDTNSTLISASLSAQSYLVVENKTSFINNTTADCVRFFDAANFLVDSVNTKPVPDHQSLSRQSDSTWCVTSPSPNAVSLPCQNLTTPTPANILLNLVDIAPDPDEGDEWLKIANPNSFSVDLAGWHIQNQSGSKRLITTCPTIAANDTCTAYFSSGFFRNSGGTATLLDPSVNSVSQISWAPPPTSIPTTRPTSTPKPSKEKAATSGGAQCPLLPSPTLPPLATTSPGLKIVTAQPTKIFSELFLFVGSLLILSPLIFRGHHQK